MVNCVFGGRDAVKSVHTCDVSFVARAEYASDSDRVCFRQTLRQWHGMTLEGKINCASHGVEPFKSRGEFERLARGPLSPRIDYSMWHCDVVGAIFLIPEDSIERGGGGFFNFSAKSVA